MTPTAKSIGNGAPDAMTGHEGPSESSPHERLRELTAILANGIHRLRRIAPVLPEPREIPAESSQSGLEAVATTRPDGPGRQPDPPVRDRKRTGRTPEA